MSSAIFNVRVSGLHGEYLSFIFESEDVVGALLEAQEALQKLNSALLKKFPQMCDCELFVVDCIERVRSVRFTDEWMKTYVDAVERTEAEAD